jgi:hypothetical protein
VVDKVGRGPRVMYTCFVCAVVVTVVVGGVVLVVCLNCMSQ